MASFPSMTPKTSDQVMGTLWPQNWKIHYCNGVAIFRFVLITRSILNLTTCAIPLCKALTNGFISSMTPKTSDQVMGCYDPKTENFIITMVLQYIVFLLITWSILDLTTCVIPLCKALTNGFISTMTCKTSDQVMGMLWPHKLKIWSLQWCCNISFCTHNSVNFELNDMCHASM